MSRFSFLLPALLVSVTLSAHADVIGTVDTTFRMLGANDKIVIEAFDDPEVTGVACHLSRAKTGGVSGSLSMAEDTSDASIACRQIGPISFGKLKDGEEVFNKRTSLLFKDVHGFSSMLT